MFCPPTSRCWYWCGLCDHTVICGVMCHVRNYGFIYKRYSGLLYGTMDTGRTLTADLGL